MDTGPIPIRFWQSLSRAEFRQVCETGELNAWQCARLWHMLDYQGPPPTSAQIMVSRADMEREFPSLKGKR